MSGYWEKLSFRERALAIFVALLLAVGLSYLVVTSALDHLDRQEAEIDRLEQQLVNFSRHMERRGRVDAAFGQIAAQHSSEWSGEEIYDRLGSEIYRLARQDPGEPGSAGSGPDIVAIPQLPPGELAYNTEGYRTYTVEFRTNDAPVDNLIAFMRRLEESPQALRIESIDIRRSPDQLGVGQATIRVNRTVVDGVEEASEIVDAPGDDRPLDWMPTTATARTAELAPFGSFEQIETDGAIEGWISENCKVTPATRWVTDGKRSARIEATEPGGLFAQSVELVGGRSYTMSIDVKSDVPLTISVMDLESAVTYDGQVEIDSNGSLRTYTLAFSVAGSGVRTMHAPAIQIHETGGSAIIDRVRIRPFEGAR